MASAADRSTPGDGGIVGQFSRSIRSAFSGHASVDKGEAKILRDAGYTQGHIDRQGNPYESNKAPKQLNQAYIWFRGSEVLTVKEADKLARDIKRGRVVTPDTITGPVIPPAVAAPIIGGAIYAAAAAAPIPFPTDAERVKRERERRKREKAARKAKAALKKAKAAKPVLDWLTKRVPYLRQLKRYWGPTGVIAVWRKRKEIWETYTAWEAQQPRVRAQVGRAPGPGAWGPTTPPLVPKPRPGPTIPPIVVSPGVISLPAPRVLPSSPPSRRAAPSPRVSPRPAPAPAPRPNVSVAPKTAPRPAPRARPGARPAPAPGTSPPTPKPVLPPWMTDIAGPLLLASVLSPKPAQRYASRPASTPAPLTQALSNPLYSVAPQAQARECKCPKPKKRSGKKACRNPIVSRSRRTRGGQRYSTVTRRLVCQA